MLAYFYFFFFHYFGVQIQSRIQSQKNTDEFLQFSRIRLNLVILHKALLSSYIISETTLFFSSFFKSYK